MTSSPALAVRIRLASACITVRPELRLHCDVLGSNRSPCRQHVFSKATFQPAPRRTFFGIGEVLGILANPGETLRSLADSKRLLEETRAEMLEQHERAQIPPKHTFSPLPGFYHREKEIKVVETCLSSVPNFTVVFGGTSVGKTALLRQVLTHERYHVLHFDLRIAGFADLPSLFFSLSCQMEQFFVDLASKLEGYDTFETEALAFKHTRLDVERRVEKTGARVKTSDIAHLLELFQSSLLKYWEFTPKDPNDPETADESTQKPIKEWEKAKLEKAKKLLSQTDAEIVTAKKQEEMQKPKGLEESRSVQEPDEETEPKCESSKTADSFEQLEDGKEKSWKPPTKKVPVFFLDEAHKLPNLIKDGEAMKCILDALLVLTKQDRLCHVLHATSDPFYLYWLRDHMKVLAHCTIITIGDPSKAEAQQYFNENLVGTLKKKLDQQPVYDARQGKEGDLVLKHEEKNGKESGVAGGYTLDFEAVYKTFGGKLAHLQGFVSDYLNSGGTLKPEDSSQFLQAYALLHYHLVHAEQNIDQINENHQTLHPTTNSQTDQQSGLELANYATKTNQPRSFTASDLLYVMQSLTRLRESEPVSQQDYPDFRPPSSEPMNLTLPYFELCRKIGVRSVDAMIRHQILDLRWNRSVSAEGESQTHERAEMNPMILPTSPVMRCAMKKVVDEYLETNSCLTND
ncbi:hypothetical protein CROQUDRAFT_46573 [Cronartium quercuum f. sp. fusiforme G11]|uniref:ATPase domain-containing protein n=1 Tax=Cronartium quercuum f. sp. fusiforme G11 TaxID=708437 RepID=A0A9P6NIP7_9BASI|nr:hypothetical protein CROQUDRAFT_46573 [Cronartium quercuum f. sp. fusiforme G11]